MRDLVVRIRGRAIERPAATEAAEADDEEAAETEEPEAVDGESAQNVPVEAIRVRPPLRRSGKRSWPALDAAARADEPRLRASFDRHARRRGADPFRGAREGGPPQGQDPGKDVPRFRLQGPSRRDRDGARDRAIRGRARGRACGCRKITGLADDLAIALRVPSVRIVAPIPGKNTVGIEVPNAERQLVRLREVIEEANGKADKMRIPIYLGKDVVGQPDGRRSGDAAASADRRPHRHRQERVPEHDHRLDADDRGGPTRCGC